MSLPLTAVATRFGTPLFVYDSALIVRQIGRLRSAFAGVPLRIKYACKALTNVAIMQLMQQQGIGIDAVSMNEARLALLAGIAPANTTFTSNGVAFTEIAEAVAAGIGINIDNLPTLERFGQQYGGRVPLCLRLKPGIMAGGNAKIQVGHARSKFGIPLAQLPQVHALVSRYGLHINGLHIHTGSEIGEARVFREGAEVLFKAAMDFPDLQFIDFGGGFKVPYKPNEQGTDMEALGRELVPAFQDFCKRYGRELALWFEPGKFLVSECGVLLVQVNQVKETPELTFLQVNSGLNHLIRPMMYDAYHEIINLSNPDGPLMPYDVVGYICETDTFASARQLPQVREGDVLAILNAGAYGFSMSSHYNGRLRPAEVLLHEGEARLIRHAETFEDLLRHQVFMSYEL